MEQKNLIEKGLERKSHGIGYEDVVVIYLTNIILFELLGYALVNFFVLNYAEAGIFLLVLAFVASTNYILFKLKWFFAARILLTTVSLIQVMVTSKVLFEWDAGFYMYYFIVIALVFALFDFGHRKGRTIIVFIILLVGLVFVLSQFVHIDYTVKYFPKETLDLLYYISATVSLMGVASLFWVFAEDVYTKRMALDRLANTDGLTQVMNRRRFFELAGEIYRETKRKNGLMTLLIIDIDFFKRINDTFGHPVGDAVLKEMAVVVASSVRKSDLFARYGGEEFAVLLKDTNGDNGMRVAEDIRKLVDEHQFRTLKKEDVHISVSIGVASMSGNFETFDALLQSADRALYHAKEQGRNRVV